MKKTTLLKTLLKSPPISAKTFKSPQKYLFTSNDIYETHTGQQTMKMKIEKINEFLNEEIRQRQFQFKQLYKMVVDLQKSKKSKCKHSVLVMEKNRSPQQLTHIPFTVLQNNQKVKKYDEISELNLSQKNLFSINDFSQLSLLKKDNSQMKMIKKQKRKSKFGTIKSHKNLPTIYSSNQQIQMQNEEENEEDLKSNLETTTSQFFSNSQTHFNFNFQQRQIVSPTKSIVSNQNFRKDKTMDEIDLKINFFENRLKSLEASHTFLKEKVQTNFIKQTDFTQQLKAINSKISNQVNAQQSIKQIVQETQTKMKQFESQLNQKYQEISEETSNNFKNIQNLIYEHECSQNEHNSAKNDLIVRVKNFQIAQNDFNLFKIQTYEEKQEVETKYFERLKESQRNQNEITTRIDALESTQGDLFKQFGDLIDMKDEKLESSKIRQSVSQNQSFAEPSFYNDKLSEVESRLQSTEEIVSQLMKVSLKLTQKMNKISNLDQKSSKRQKSNTKTCEKLPQKNLGLSDGYWSLKEELSKIDEEQIQSSRELIDESFLYNEENDEVSQKIKIIEEELITEAISTQ